MEREEAKTKLDYIRDNYGLTEAQIKAIDMGIEALSAPTDGDLISRQGLLLQIEKDADGSPGWYGDTWQFIKTIKSMPSAEPKTERWIPIKWHYITDEEREENRYQKDWVCYLDCEMPEDEQEIIVTTNHGRVEKDVCYLDGEFSLDSGWDWIEDIVAWMPLPEPYKGGE